MTNEELVIQIQNGRDDLMSQLWEQVAGLVKWKANRVINALDGGGGVEFDDLYNSGYLALVDAVPTYDPEGGAFSTWFMFYLKTAFEVATGYRTKSQREDPSRHALSLDAPLSDDPNSSSLDEIIKDPRGESALEAVERRIYSQQLHEAVETVLAVLPDVQADVLRQRYYREMTLAETARELGLSPEATRQRECKALRKLRQAKQAAVLRPFLDFDCFHGSGLGSFQNSGMSIQERYLVLQEQEEKRRRQKRAEEQRWKLDEEIRQRVELRVQQILNGNAPDPRDGLETTRKN